MHLDAWQESADTGADHRRWREIVESWDPHDPADVRLTGFSSDEGVRRNGGRQGATAGPSVIRGELGALEAHGDLRVAYLPGAVVAGDDLEDGQQAMGEIIASLLRPTPRGRVIVLGGGHETAYASYLGLAGAGLLDGDARLGILNLDAHFDLREDERATSGTPFRQIALAEQAAGREFRYAVAGVSRPNNSPVLFETAAALGTRYLEDVDCSRAEIEAFVADFAAGVDLLYLSLDLDVLPASVAPGVSAPAGLGVELHVIHHAVRVAAASGKLVLADIVELNPRFDDDNRTARTAARLVHTMATTPAG